MQNRITRVVIIALLWARAVSTPGGESHRFDEPGTLRFSEPQFYLSCCDGSGAADLNDRLFASVNDEDSQLRIYDRLRPGLPVQSISLESWLELKKKEGEPDLEAIARWQNYLFIVGSHSRSRDGKKRANTRRLLCLAYEVIDGTVRARPFGESRDDLLDGLESAPELRALSLEAASQLPSDHPGALNIEGMSTTPEGHLLLGFRGPVSQGKALVVPILNPLAWVTGAQVRFGPPVRLDLGGRGIRAMARVGAVVYLVGEFELGKKDIRLYAWDGSSPAPRDSWPVELRGFDPESILAFPEQPRVLRLLSDDGSGKLNGVECRDLNESQKRFLTWQILLP